MFEENTISEKRYIVNRAVLSNRVILLYLNHNFLKHYDKKIIADRFDLIRVRVDNRLRESSR